MKIRATTVCWKGSKILLVAKKSTKWSLPGGRKARGETMREAAVRELVEETQMRTKKLRLVCQYKHPKVAQHVYEVFVKRGTTASPDHEIRHCRWVDPKAMGKLAIGSGTLKILQILNKRAR
jgi:8-oxo-dGTP diphosphatase